ncbi:hypothetical protein Lepto7375DRAFT_1619 [Leptolyngbya sp. PCC 7375]|nr:hypothetical protein Lepto7375DRAFT_1619 [Leptolyngbya sp. PCC 7375]
MQGLTKVSKAINRGITAVAMTIAIATIYAAMPAGNQANSGEVLRHQIQAILKLHQADKEITQDMQDSQESLATLLLSSRTKAYSHQ